MKKSMNKRSKWLLPVLLCGLILLCFAALWRLGNKQDGTAAPAATQPPKEKLLSLNAQDVASIQILTPRNEQYTLLQQNGTLTYQGQMIRSVIAENLLSAVCTLIAEDTVLSLAQDVVSLADFGLSPARCSAQVTLHSGQTHTLLVGDTLPIGIPYRYLMLDDRPFVYAASADLYEWFSYAPSALVPVEQPVWNAEFWDEAVLTGENERRLVRTDWGWQLLAPFSYPADSAAVTQFLAAVEDIAFAAFVGDAQTLDLAAYGLDRPRLTLTLRQSATVADYYDETGAWTHNVLLPEETITLAFGSETDGDYVYCMYLDKVYTATRFQTAFLWDRDHTALCDPTPLDVPVSALEKLVCTVDGVTAVYHITLTEQLQPNGELKTDADGQVLYDVTVTKDGAAMDADAFLTWYMQLQRLSPSAGGTLAAHEDKAPLASFAFTGVNLTRTARLYALDALHLMLETDGTALYYAPAAEFDPLLALP